VQNAAAVGAGAAALGAVLALTVSSSGIAPVVGAVIAGVIGATGGTQANNIVKWWRHGASANS
jgi:integral membrane sensor domain MASE1